MSGCVAKKYQAIADTDLDMFISKLNEATIDGWTLEGQPVIMRSGSYDKVFQLISIDEDEY